MRTAYILSSQILQKSIWIVLISLFITSCSLFSVGKRAVFYSEMSRVPVIVTYDNAIAVQTGNSKQNSALLIYKITLKTDTIHRKIELKGYQALNKKYQDNFRIKVKGFSKADLNNYEFYWIDPDLKENKLTIIK
jgi:hypothetical protein